MPNFGLKTNITSGSLRNYSLLRASDFPDTTGLYIWPLNGVGSFSGVNSYGGSDLTQIGSVSTGANHLGVTVYNTLNGSSSAMYVNDSNFTDTGSFTICGWFKQNGTSGSQNLMSNGSSFYTYTSGGNLIVNLFYGVSSYVSTSIPASFLSDGLYHHICVVYNQSATAVTIIVDGRILAYNLNSSLSSRYNAGGSNKLGYGVYWNGSLNNPFNGQICDVFYKKTALTFSQIRRIFVTGSKYLAYLDSNSKVKIDGENLGNYWIQYDIASKVTCSGGGYSTSYASGIPYKTPSGHWKLSTVVAFQDTSGSRTAYTLNFSGVNFGPYYQTVAVEGNGVWGGATVNAGNGDMSITTSVGTGGARMFGDLTLNSMPSWALDLSTLY